MSLIPSRLNSAHRRLIIDASVLINLLGSRAPGAVLRGLQRVFEIDEITLQEVDTDPSTNYSALETLAELRQRGLLNVVQMSPEAYERFLEFTGADAPDDLDDGEAATLAHASINDEYIAVIDEIKATRIATAQNPPIETLNTLDLLSAPDLISRLGEENVADVIYFALRNARMRVPSSARRWTAIFLGHARATECPGLGRYSRMDALQFSHEVASGR